MRGFNFAGSEALLVFHTMQLVGGLTHRQRYIDSSDMKTFPAFILFPTEVTQRHLREGWPSIARNLGLKTKLIDEVFGNVRIKL